MSLWLDLHVGSEWIGAMGIRRTQFLDLSDKDAIADVVSTYEVWAADPKRLYRNGKPKMIGTVEHRYGDGAWVLLSKAAALVGL